MTNKAPSDWVVLFSFGYTFWYTFWFIMLDWYCAEYAIFDVRHIIFFMRCVKNHIMELGSTPLGSTIWKPCKHGVCGAFLFLRYTLWYTFWFEYVLEDIIDDFGGTVLLPFDLMTVYGIGVHTGRMTNNGFQELHRQVRLV